MSPSFGSTEAKLSHVRARFRAEITPVSAGRNSPKTRVSTRFLVLTAFGRQWYRPSFPRRIFHDTFGGGAVDAEAVFAGSRSDACAP
jgi:hypothetical protein